MRQLSQIIRDLFRLRGERRPARKLRASARLEIETLENRALMSANFGSVSGLVYIDNSHAGVIRSGDALVPGVSVTLKEATYELTVHTTTSQGGAFNFQDVPDGHYTLTVGPIPALRNGAAQTYNITVVGTANTQQNAGFQGGINPRYINLSMFMNNATYSGLPYSSPGNGAPVAADKISPKSTTPVAESLSSTKTTTMVDLAGQFTHPNFADSQVTFNITTSSDGTAATSKTQQVKVNLLDNEAPQTVANFYDYATAPAGSSSTYINSFFHRLTTPSNGGFTALQGGGATVDPATGTLSPITSLGNIPDELGRTETAGTLAMGNTGAANSGSDNFFFNVTDNTSALTPSYSVFGNVADAASMNALKQLATTPTYNLSSSTFATTAGLSSASVPLTLPTGSSTPAQYPSGVGASSQYLVINSITTDPNRNFLTYTVSPGSNGDVTASLVNEKLTFTRVSAGTTTFTVTATDKYGATATETFQVTAS